MKSLSKLTYAVGMLLGILIAASAALAATIPAGTPLVTRTVAALSDHERVGAPLKVRLEQAVAVKGKVLLPAGTEFTAVVETSFKRPGGSGPLSVNLKALSHNGQRIPVQTTGAFRLDRFKTKRGVSVSGREFMFPSGTQLVFHLGQPLTW
jgi:hypothetical protein